MTVWNPAITTVIQNLKPGWVRQRIFHSNSQFLQMVDALTPATKFLGAAGQLSDGESAVRNEIAAWRTDTRSANLLAILGPNEPNGNPGGFSAGGPDNTVRQMYWIADEVANGGTWTHRAGNHPPMVVGPALKRAGFSGDDDTQYDSDLAALAAASYNPGSGALRLRDFPAAFPTLTFRHDFHRYLGASSPGLRVNGKDSSGTLIPGIPLGADGKCSLFTSEQYRVQQVASNIPVGFWTESGWTDSDGSPSDAQRALNAQETYLRAFLAGVGPAIYETVDEYPLYGTREDYFGIYTLADTDKRTAGPKPIYTALQKILGYTGSASCSGVLWIEPLAGVLPDCGVVVFSKAAGGWDVYILAEARTTIDFVVAPTHTVVGKSFTSKDSWGNLHFSVNLSSPMTVLQVT